MSETHYYVYKIINLIDGKYYIGQRHCCCPIEKDNYMGSGKLIKLALKKYGRDNFKKEILEICPTKETLDEAERRWIGEDWLIDECYNLRPGGIGGSNTEGTMWITDGVENNLIKVTETIPKGFQRGRTFSEEHRHMMAEHGWQKGCTPWNAGLKLTEEQLQNHVGFNVGNPSNTGKIWVNNGVESTLINATEALPEGYVFGRLMTNGLRRALDAAHAAHVGKPSPTRGRHMTPEQRRKLSERCKGRPSPFKGHHVTEEMLRKRRETLKTSKAFHDKINSPEYRAKISAANTGKLWYNNGIINLRFKIGDIIPEGFVRGRIGYKRSKCDEQKS